MTVRTNQANRNGVYFITFTCYNWLPLFQVTESYGLVYKWFDYLKSKGHYVLGYVIMPNHVHIIIAFTESNKSINITLGNAKRFLAYGIVQKLQTANENSLLTILENGVNPSDRRKNKLHEVFEPSFDCKEILHEDMLLTKLTYLHNNPCAGKWRLTTDPIDYLHSSAKFYYTGVSDGYAITDYRFLDKINLSKNLALAHAESSSRDSAKD